jgi:hypothetical protein
MIVGLSKISQIVAIRQWQKTEIAITPAEMPKVPALLTKRKKNMGRARRRAFANATEWFRTRAEDERAQPRPHMADDELGKSKKEAEKSSNKANTWKVARKRKEKGEPESRRDRELTRGPLA